MSPDVEKGILAPAPKTVTCGRNQKDLAAGLGRWILKSHKRTSFSFSMTTTALVTGASGFIALHLVDLLLKKGYRVVGTVRSESKGQKLKKNFGEKFTYELVPDMTVDGAFDDALKANTDVKYIFHTASPFFYDTQDPENDLLIPAIRGTESILGSIKSYAPQVEKVVLTSSDAAIYNATDEQNAELSFDETSWNNDTYEEALKDPIAAYYGAKSHAEKLAWKFVEEQKPNFSLTAVNPSYVFGPQLFDEDAKGKLNTSNELIASLLKLGPEDSFEIDKGGFVDVRDVARVHLFPIENDIGVGKRLFATGGKFSTQMMIDTINDRFPELREKIPVGEPGTGPQHIASLAKVSNEKTRELTGIEFNSIENLVFDTVKQILQNQ